MAPKTAPKTTYYKRFKCPLGPLTLIANDHALLAVLWPSKHTENLIRTMGKESRRHPILNKASEQLREYFAGKRKKFELPIEMRGTPFQKKVWRELQKIPYGKTLSYFDLASRTGSPKACRAVGSANGRNLISIVVPCHRVIGKNGALSGFAAGPEVKRFLLKLEGKVI